MRIVPVRPDWFSPHPLSDEIDCYLGRSGDFQCFRTSLDFSQFYEARGESEVFAEDGQVPPGAK
jgi:hypothetical protein